MSGRVCVVAGVGPGTGAALSRRFAVRTAPRWVGSGMFRQQFQLMRAIGILALTAPKSAAAGAPGGRRCGSSAGGAT